PGRADPFELPLGATSVGDEVGDGDECQVVLAGEDLELVEAGHVLDVLLADDLAQDTRRSQSGETAQVDGGLGVTRPAQYAAFLRPQRHNVTGTGEVHRARRRVR